MLFTDSFYHDDAQAEDMAQCDCPPQCRPRYLQQNVLDGVTLLQREGLPHGYSCRSKYHHDEIVSKQHESEVIWSINPLLEQPMHGLFVGVMA